MITITVGLGLLCGRGQGGGRRGQVLCEECSEGIKRVNKVLRHGPCTNNGTLGVSTFCTPACRSLQAAQRGEESLIQSKPDRCNQQHLALCLALVFIYAPLCCSADNDLAQDLLFHLS